MYKWKEFNDFTYVVLHGPEKDINLREDVDLYIINPEGLKWLVAQKDLPEWECLIVDESTKFKDSTNKRFKLLKKMLPTFSRRWILTGTPMPNTITDLFGQIYILDRGNALEPYITRFRLKYLYRPGYNAWEWKPQPGAFGRIIKKIDPLVLRLKGEDYLEMPDINFVTIPVDLPPKIMEIYKEVENEFIYSLEEGLIMAANAAAAGTKLRQMANGAVYLEDGGYTVLHDAKLDALEDLMEELSGHPKILLYEFNHDRERLLAKYPDAVDVKTTKDFPKLVDDFNAGKIDILLGHPASIGHGLNLQEACYHQIWFGITWNFEHYDQTVRRIYRQGQPNPIVMIYHITAQNTRDVRVAKVLKQKDKNQSDLLDALRS